MSGLSGGEWFGLAKCREHDPDLFFPEAQLGRRRQVAEAVAVCRTCPVIVECHNYAEAHRQRFGVWGGQDRGAGPENRRAVRKVKAPPPMDPWIAHRLYHYGQQRRSAYGA